MPLDFPNSPSNGDTYNAGGKTWSYNGSVWSLVGVSVNATPEDGSITTAKIADANVTTAKVAANAITQAKLASNLSAVTVTTTANRDTDIPSPFTGQLAVLTDTRKIQLYDGTSWVNVSLAPPETPTSLSATALGNTSVSIAFTPGGANGSPITNYKYALSTNGGSTYGAFTALDPADTTSPITISGLTQSTTYTIKLKAVNDMGDSVESAAVTVSTLAVPDAPTSLSATPSTTSVSISFTPGSDNGFTITNYQYALSTNGGSTYGSFTTLDPADATSPITISGLTNDTTYYVKLKAVNSGGAGPESSAVSFTTIALITVDYLVIAGGGGGGTRHAGGGGAGGLRSTVTASGGTPGTVETPLVTVANTNYAVQIGAGGGASASGVSSSFSTITSVGGGRGGDNGQPGATGGSGGGGANGGAGGAGTANQGFGGSTTTFGGAGGGAGQAGTTSGGAGYNGGAGVSVAITGSSVTYAGGGGGGGATQGGAAGAGGAGGGGTGGYNGTGANGTTNTGGGAGGGGAIDGSSYNGGSGGSGIVVLRYPNTRTITVGAGLTASHTNADAGGGNRYTRLTAGSGNVSWA